MTQRVIKYRAWDKEYSDFSEEPFFRLSISKDGQIYNSDLDKWYQPGERYIIQFFTGLTDKHGKEIYEGDIYEYEAWHGGIEHAMLEKSLKEQGKPLPSYKERRVILSHPYGHFITRKLDDITDMTYSGDTFSHSPATTATWEVIGNIYSNPELVDPEIIENGNS